jgi:hypothetical protein
MSIRSAASCVHPLQDNFAPRAALIVFDVVVMMFENNRSVDLPPHNAQESASCGADSLYDGFMNTI